MLINFKKMKKITLVIAMFTMAMAASAQYAGHKFFDNWSIGAEGGVTMNLHDGDTPNGAVAGINFTKGITPVVSFEFQVQAGINNNANWNMGHSSNVIDNATLMGNTKINLMNWFGGYKGAPRLFEIQARGGVGYMRYFYPNYEGNPTKIGNDLNRCVFKCGLDFDFNLGQKKAWTVSLRPAVVVKTGRETSPYFLGCDYGECNKFGHNAVAEFVAGVTYHFKTSNGSHYFTEVKPVEVTKVVEKVVEKPVDKIVEKVVEKVVTKNVGNVTVEFAQNKATLSNTAKAKLNTIEKGTSVVLDGYASPEGRKAYNQKLSERRCEAVKAYLVERGVKVVDVNAHGAAGVESQRVVYVTIK